MRVSWPEKVLRRNVEESRVQVLMDTLAQDILLDLLSAPYSPAYAAR